MSVDNLGFEMVSGIRELEELATAEYARALNECDHEELVKRGAASVVFGHEVVGIGFEIQDQQGLVWFQLKNIADPESLQFAVDGETVHALLLAVRLAYPDGHSIRGAVLWHSHYRREKPSKVDVQNFPTWLAREGIVYHTPTQVSTAYDNSGVISRLMPTPAESLTTTGR